MKYIRDRIRSILALDDPPHKLALAFALGVFIAFTPTIGLHTLSCLFLAWVFRVSKLVALTGTFINNPWTIVPLYGFCLWFGIKITGSGDTVPAIAWKEIGFSNAFLLLKPYLWPFIAGSLATGVVASIASYVLFYWAAARYRKVQKG
jgi:uncharacterized protein (DUF2062 family)